MSKDHRDRKKITWNAGAFFVASSEGVVCVSFSTSSGRPNGPFYKDWTYVPWQHLGLTSKVEAPKYELVMVDATRCFGTCPADLLRLAQNSDSSGFLDYWYPFCLGVPQATQPFDKEYAAELLAVKPSDVYNSISCWLASAPGAAIDRCDAEAKAVANRLQQLQSLIENDSTLSVRECCFRVVPSWRRDFNEAAKKGELGPLPELEGFLCAGGDAAAWGRRCVQKRIRHKLNLVLAAATFAAIAVATLRLRRCRH